MKPKGALSVVVASAVILGGSLGTSARPAVAAAVISPATVATVPGHVGDPFQATLSFSPTATWSVVSGELPPGVALGGGQISGVPTQAGAYTFVVRAADSATSATKAYTILVNPPVTTGYDSRVNQVLIARDVFPSPGDCNHTGYLTYAIADLWLDQDTTFANDQLASVKITQIGGIPKSCDTSIDQSRNNLALGYLIRPYMLYNASSSYFPGRLTSAAQNNLLAQIWAYARAYSRLDQAPDTWSIYDSENHDAQAESFDLLAAQILKDKPGYRTQKYGDGSTAAQQYTAWRNHWSNYFDERAKRGLFIESEAPTYHGYTLQAILNIYNFADDPVLRQKAGMILDLDFADYAQEELNNVWAGPKSRSYPADSYDGAGDSMTDLGILLFGSSAAIGGSNHALMLATSGYSPPPVVRSLATNRTAMGSFEYVTRRPGYGLTFPDTSHDWHVTATKSVLNYSYVTPDYIMGTTELWPNDPHIAPSSQNRWEGISFSGGSNDRVYPQAAPSTVSPCNDAFLSVQYKNTLITQKRTVGKTITKDCAKKATLVYFSADLDSIVERHGWLFVTEGATYLAVRPASGTYHWLTPAKNRAPQRAQRFIQLSDLASPIVFDAGRVAAFAGPADFQSRVIGAFSYAKGVLHFEGSDNTSLTMFHDSAEPPLVNGRTPNLAPDKVFNSPYMQSVFGSGKITITFGAQRAGYDFSNRTKPVKVVT